MSVGGEGAKVHPACIICGRKLTLAEATVASAYANGQPAFACESHRNGLDTLIVGCYVWRVQQALQPQLPLLPAREKRRVTSQFAMMGDVVRHLHTRTAVGLAVVITERPLALLSVLRKRWKSIERLLQSRRAATLEPLRLTALTAELARFYDLKFTAALGSPANVLLVAPTNIADIPTSCATVYICMPLAPAYRAALARAVPHALQVDYGLE